MDDLLREFLTETNESLDLVDVELVRFEQDPNNARILDNIFRLVHTIKGTCGFLGLPRLEALAHAAETLMGKFRDGMAVTGEAVTIILSTLDRIKDVRPTLATGYLVFDLNQQLDAAAVAADHGHDAFHPWDPFVTPELLEDCRSRCLRVNSWTVNEPERWSELVSWGVDGIITDTPGRLVSALA